MNRKTTSFITDGGDRRHGEVDGVDQRPLLHLGHVIDDPEALLALLLHGARPISAQSELVLGGRGRSQIWVDFGLWEAESRRNL